MSFRFKQFSIHHDKSAMKVGTDGVLLGAWAPVENAPFSILDIGAGTGLIALMLAQRTDAEQIDAIEIDAGAYEDCVGNFENSAWNDRLFCYHASLDAFMDELEDEDPSDSEQAQQYDLIVSNPPFYSDGFSSGDDRRDAARMSASLPFSDLCEAASMLLSEVGVLCVILPYEEEEAFLSHALENDLYPFKITRVKGTPDTRIKRSMLAFSREKRKVETDELVIEFTRHNYTPDYIELTKDFYLKM